MDDLAAALARIAALEAQVAALAARGGAAPTGMQTLTEHNRHGETTTQFAHGKAAGVSCPMCVALFADHVEMHVASLGNIGVGSINGKNMVVCPRCLFTGLRM